MIKLAATARCQDDITGELYRMVSHDAKVATAEMKEADFGPLDIAISD
ncbi:MAG TPA: hypothetical protein VK999_04465 [Methylotenera sp.]|nr:hypothetical protein [Methylotenera sp.]